MPTSADTRPASRSAAATTPGSARPGRAATLLVALVAFLAGGAGLLALVPEAARLAVAGTALTLTGVGLAVLGVVQARMEARAAELAADCARARADAETLRDEVWHLQESETRHRAVLDTLGDVVTRWRHGGEVVYANDAARRLFPDGHIDPAGAPDADPGTPRPADLCLETASGPRWFARRDVPVRDPGSGEPLIQTILRDVTDRRRIEDALVAARNQAETANASKSRFLATVSHEIRTPLNGILGMAGLLRDTRLTAEQASYVEAIRGSGEILLMLINEVLDMSKIEAGRLDLAPGPVELAPLAEGVSELLAPRAQAKGLEIACAIAPDMPERIVVDGVRLRQILFNLAGNGLKFTEEGGVAIEIAPVEPGGMEAGDAETCDGTPTRFAVTVTDTGIGFSEEDAERLFGEFEQVDHGPARRFDGAGLGLAISRRLARLMGGDITAVSTPGAGARFRVELPLERAESDGAGPPHAPPRTPALAGRRIAFVTTSRVEGPLLARRLAAEGARAELIAPGDPDGDETLLAADLILLDPGAVADAGAWLAGAHAAGAEAPAVVLIAPTERDRLPRLKAAGFGAYLIRPVRAASLVQVATAMLDGPQGAHDWDGLPDPHAGPADRHDRTPAIRPLHLLVADDNDINRMLTEALVRKLGHECTVVIDGASALEALQSPQGFDMVLMDLHMPGIDGLTAIHRFRDLERRKGWPAVPVYAVTADVTPEARDAALAAGADAVLAKPLDPERLGTALATATARRSA